MDQSFPPRQRGLAPTGSSTPTTRGGSAASLRPRSTRRPICGLAPATSASAERESRQLSGCWGGGRVHQPPQSYPGGALFFFPIEHFEVENSEIKNLKSKIWKPNFWKSKFAKKIARPRPQCGWVDPPPLDLPAQPWNRHLHHRRPAVDDRHQHQPAAAGGLPPPGPCLGLSSSPLWVRAVQRAR